MLPRLIGLVFLLVCTPSVAFAMPPIDSLDSSGEAKESHLAQAVYTQIANDKSLGIRGLEVGAIGGEIILRGTVDSYYAWQAAEKSIRNRIGVRQVTNLLTIAGSGSAGDSSLALRVNAALAGNSYLGNMELRAVAAGDTVVLDGIVLSAFEWEQARRTAASVSGVTMINNRIAVVDNLLAGGESWAADGNNDSPEVRALIDSYYRKQGVNPELAFKIAPDTVTNLAAGWADSLELHPPKAGGKPRVVNPETRYYEAFNFVGAGIWLIKKAFGWDKKKEKKKKND